MRKLWLVVLVASGIGWAQDPVRVSPQDYKVEIENSWVRVLRVKHGPRARVALHEHPASVAVCLTDVHERLTFPDGKTREISCKAGEVTYNEATQHIEENLSDQPLEAAIIELKPDAPKVKGWPVALDPVKLDPEHHLVPFENERVRVLRTILEPHLKSPMHEHPHYVVVYLTELHTTMTLADGRAIDNPRRPGEIAWRDPLKHVTENLGDRTAVEIQVELK
jgi:beta-alanine degradation protein BauB